MPAVKHPSFAVSLAYLRCYFYSGWAFLIPYLAVYLLYYITKWPVNPVVSGAEPRMEDLVAQPTNWVPCMLYVYWAIHVVHVICASVALWSWFSSYRSKCQEPSREVITNSDCVACEIEAQQIRPPSAYAPTSDIGPLTSSLCPLVLRFAPWALLALLFYIPGVYLEWPSDPWEHLRRINEWRILDTVGAHSSWVKSSYFIPYSMLSWCIGLRQLFWLDFYYTGICLLLCWQYYRFSRACGLGERASMIFVIIQTLLFGNNIFSFYRYYGISTSIYAQLGAIALTRIVLEWATFGQTNLNRRAPENTSPFNASSVQPLNLSAFQSLSPRSSFWHFPSVFWLLTSSLSLLAFTALNHPQGLGIAGLGTLAIIVWRLIEWKRSMAYYLALAVTVSSITTVMWAQRYSTIGGIYRMQGWLNPLYGFNFFSSESPAFDRAAQIFGIFGAINIVCGLWLVVRKKHIIGWLTVLPVLALALPCFALLFSKIIFSRTYAENIITFQRLFFAVPTGLAVVAMGAGIRGKPVDVKFVGEPARRQRDSDIVLLPTSHCILLSASLASAALFPSIPPTYNRFWNAMQAVPADLRLRHLVALWTAATVAQSKDKNTLMIDTVIGSDVYECFAPNRYPNAFRPIQDPVDASELSQQITWLNFFDASKTDGLRSRRLSATKFSKEVVVLSSDENQTESPSTLDFSSKNPAWTTIAGSNHQQVFSAGTSIVSNPPGVATEVFNSEMIPVSPTKRYQLTCAVRQISGGPTTNYLAVIWYDRDKKKLISSQPYPEGAGSPTGWSNGTYSYYGLRGQTAPSEWTEYAITFGPRMYASIPTNAAFIRIGALLNFQSTPEAQVQFSKVQLQSNLIQRYLIWLPQEQPSYTPASLAACLSSHWPTQRVAMDHAGINEIRAQLRLLQAAGRSAQ